MLKFFISISVLILSSCSGGTEIAQIREIPDLDPNGRVYKTLGPTDFKMYPRSVGKIRTAFVFVDFEGVPGKDRPEDLAKELTCGDKASDWFKQQSFNKMTMEFHCPSKEWRTMSKAPKEYDSRTTATHRAYIAEALNLFPEIDFTKYEYVVVIPSNKKRMGVGTACFSEVKKRGAKTKHGNINLGVTFGTSNFSELTYYTLIHELGHAMGLPDTYDIRVRGLKHRAVVGAWDLMCDTGNGANFLGWHRHKLEWVDKSRKHFMTEKELNVTLSPFSDDKGMSMIVIPAFDSEKHSKVFAVELALPIRASGKEIDKEKPYGEGVLIYSVDARIPTGTRPLVMYPKSKDYSKVYSFTYKAPHLAGDIFKHEDAPFKVEVLSKEGSKYKVRITKQ